MKWFQQRINIDGLVAPKGYKVINVDVYEALGEMVVTFKDVRKWKEQ